MKFSGIIGFWDKDVEVRPGVYKPNVIEKQYTGDVLQNQRSFQPVNDQPNDDLTINNRISIVADLYMQEHWPSIKYVIWKGSKWKVKMIDVGYPRLTLTIGGLYNENSPS